MKYKTKNILIGVIVIVIGSLGLLYPLYDYDNLNNKYKIKESNEPDVINLGSSHGDSFVYNDFNINGQKMNTPANTLYYDLQVYKSVKDKLRENTVVIIPLSYYSFGIDENRSDRKDYNFEDQYYYSLPPNFIYDYSFSNHLDLVSKKIKDNIPKILNGIKKNDFGHNASSTDVMEIISNIDIVKKNNYNFVKKGQLRSKHHKKISKRENIDINKQYLSELVSLIKSNNHIPVLTATPFHYQYNKHFSNKWMKEFFLDHINYVCSNHDVPFLNYSNHERFTRKDHLFTNQDHLNLRGKVYFTYMFFEDLKNNGIIENQILHLPKKIILENKKMSKDLILKSLSLNKKEDVTDFIFEFNNNIVDYKNFRFAFHLLDENNRIVQSSDIRNVKSKLKDNTLVKKLPSEKLKGISKIRFNFYDRVNNKSIKKTDKIIIQLKDIK